MKFIFLLTIFISSSVFSQIPTLTSPVMDEASVLKNKPELEAKIRTVYNNGLGPQVNILVIPSLNGQSLEEYANQVFTSWKLGDAKRDDGVLFLIVVNDRKMRIEVGQGLEGSLTDLYSKRILGSLKTYFKAGDYSGGINHGLDQILAIVSKEDAVQTPEQIQSIKQKKIDQEKETSDFLFTVFSALVGLAMVIFPIGIVRKNNQELKSVQVDLNKSKEKLQKNKNEIIEVENRYKEGSIEKVKANLEAKIVELKKDESKLEDKLSTLKKQEEKSDSFLFNNKKHHLQSLQTDIYISSDKIIQYKRFIDGKES